MIKIPEFERPLHSFLNEYMRLWRVHPQPAQRFPHVSVARLMWKTSGTKVLLSSKDVGSLIWLTEGFTIGTEWCVIHRQAGPPQDMFSDNEVFMRFKNCEVDNIWMPDIVREAPEESGWISINVLLSCELLVNWGMVYPHGPPPELGQS